MFKHYQLHRFLSMFWRIFFLHKLNCKALTIERESNAVDFFLGQLRKLGLTTTVVGSGRGQHELCKRYFHLRVVLLIK